MSSPALKVEEESNVRVLHDLQRNFLSQLETLDPKGGSARGIRVGSNDIVSQLETLVSLVENSQEVIDTLTAAIRDHEETVYDLKNRLAQETAQKDAAYQHAARGEVAVRVEKERADAAEARAKFAEEEVRRLEGREAVISERLARLTAVISNLASAAQVRSPLLTSAA